MADVLVVLVFVAFVLLCVIYVRWCDRIIGPDPAQSGFRDEDPSRSVEHEVVA